MVGNQLIVHPEVIPLLRRKGDVGDGVPYVLKSTTSSTSSSSVVQVSTLYPFLN